MAGFNDFFFPKFQKLMGPVNRVEAVISPCLMRLVMPCSNIKHNSACESYLKNKWHSSLFSTPITHVSVDWNIDPPWVTWNNIKMLEVPGYDKEEGHRSMRMDLKYAMRRFILCANLIGPWGAQIKHIFGYASEGVPRWD